MKSEKSLHCSLNKYRAQYAKMAIAGDVLFDFLLQYSFEVNAAPLGSSMEHMLESVAKSTRRRVVTSKTQAISTSLRVRLTRPLTCRSTERVVNAHLFN